MSRIPLVLVVDDAPDNREGIAEYLRYTGFRTAEAASGQEALTQARRFHPDVVLLDMRLPDLDGAEVSRRLRRAPGTRTAAIIAFSASVFSSDVATAIESGCNAFLAKPCLPDAVVTEIRRLLDRSPRPCDREANTDGSLSRRVAAASDFGAGRTTAGNDRRRTTKCMSGRARSAAHATLQSSAPGAAVRC